MAIFFPLGQKQGFSHFAFHVKRMKLRGYLLQEPVFLEAAVFKLFPKKLFSNY